MAQKIVPCLWFDGAAEEAARFYTSLLPDSRIDKVVRAPTAYQAGEAGAVLVVEFTLAGLHYIALNAGPQARFNDAVSFQIHTEDQAETDRLWEAITADGGTERDCSWCEDRWGLRWQIVPRRLVELMGDPDQARAARAMQAMMTMRKIDIAALEAAVEPA
ncbi:VOC family protein [Sphingomonas sp. ABOLD]|uniref:2-polyprenyl-6-hydroxyphenyl methylase/3-demethylubiquinone-9 3-methyltransferase n=1 Tax=Sphingomonas trueperi TaxID=53317 RepID=A0A7X5Y0H3_9SPHN|nr:MULTISPECIES: VOC family protein [Sphingomonas]NJB98782.1 2-polyprenyl-6-hydroxyphenyl methylase/3-demethylubiquinone-9 3-methyltransferase [Sphingomonas trueperi]RSV52363.1 VOC family protein [Sphingomonas sp. ABOLD]